LKNDFEEQELREVLASFPGVVVEDNISANQYPMPFFCSGKDEVYVGRIRRDYSQPNTLNCWIVSDNLRKGAATNAVQIAEYMVAQGLV
jgi:aspartate-semialdehyde dehydrogenase